MKSKISSRSHARTTARPPETGSARDHYMREKARRAEQAKPDSELLAAAKREYLAMLEADAAKGKGGRPKKKAARPAADEEDLLGDADEHADAHVEEGAAGDDE